MKMKRNNKTDARPGEKGARSFRRSFGMAVLSVFAAVAVALFGAAPAFADTATSGPAIDKKVEENAEHTGGTISLSVTGSASSTTTHTNANVIFVVDTSGSMDYPTGAYTLQESSYGAYDDKGNDLYYLDTDWFGNQHYYRVSDSWDWVTGTVYTKDSATGAYSEYAGNRYNKVSTGGTRLDAAKSAVKSAASTILGQQNTKVSLVTFSTNATPVLNPTNNLSSFDDKVDKLSANGGTNWEAGLYKAQRLVSNDSNTSNYVIFVSDGNPTFRNSANGNTYRKPGYSVYGTGNSDPNDYNFNAADTVARSLVANGVTLYNINAFGDATNMQNLGGINADHYFNASDSTSLRNALSKIVQYIVNAHGYRDVTMTDTLSDAVVAKTADGKLDSNSVTVGVKDEHGDTVKLTKNSDGSYSYTKDGAPKTFGGPTVKDKTVTWKLSKPGHAYELEDGWTYTASFDVLFTQDTLNKAAELLNGTLASDPDMKVEDDVVKAYTNTASGNNVSYVEETTVDNNTTSAEGTKDFDCPVLNVPVASNLTVSKKVSGNAANKGESYNFVLSSTALAGKTCDSSGNTVTFDSNGQYTFQLSHGQSKSFAGIPVGTEVTVKETGLSGNAKTSTTVKVDGGSAEIVKAEGSNAKETDPKSVAVTAQAYKLEDGKLVAPTNANTVEYTNTSTLVPQTGIKIDSLPMVVLLGVAVAGGVAVAAGVRKNHGREE